MRIPRKLKKKAKNGKVSMPMIRDMYIQMAEELAKGFRSFESKSMNALEHLNNN